MMTAARPELLCPAGAEAVRRAVARDQAAARREFLLAPPPWLARRLLPLLADPRDAPILFLFINVATMVLPAAAALFRWAPTSHAWGAAYLAATYALFLQRFMLALHYSEHRKLFRKDLWVLNLGAPLLLAPLFGIPSGMYRLHHCVMHHVGNNAAAADASSTEPYRRDSAAHFAAYWARHALAAWLEVPCHAVRRGRWRLAAGCLATEGAYLAAAAAAARAAPVAALWALALPYAVSSLALMFGNWSQHCFIDPSSPGSNHGLAYNCVGCPDNQMSFNDGYHILHHHNSQLHWSEFPSKLCASLEEHAAKGALVFSGVGFFDVGLAVLTRRWGFLRRHLVRYSAALAAMSDEEVTGMLRGRLAPVRR